MSPSSSLPTTQLFFETPLLQLLGPCLQIVNVNMNGHGNSNMWSHRIKTKSR